MAKRFETFAHGEFYHVYNRGTEKRTIFKDVADYDRFIELLYLSNTNAPVNVRDIRRTQQTIYDFDRGDLLVHIGLYCLMPNHFHILLTPNHDDGVQTFMQKLSTAYSMYFNKRYERVGTLFQNRFKARHAKFDEYLKYLFAYIHLNPVKLIQSDWKEVGIRDTEKAKEYLSTYRYSSLHDYLGERIESKILAPERFPGYFATKEEVSKELLEWLTYNSDREDAAYTAP